MHKSKTAAADEIKQQWHDFLAANVSCATCKHSSPVDLFTLHCKHPESFPRDVPPWSECECHTLRDPKIQAEFDRQHEIFIDHMMPIWEAEQR